MSSPGSGHLAGVGGGILHPPSQQNTLPTLRSAAGGRQPEPAWALKEKAGGGTSAARGTR